MGLLPSLLEPDLKLQWAHMHLERLKLEIGKFCKDNPTTFSSEEDTQAREYLVKIAHPLLFNAIHAVLTFADFVSNLRACLDYTAWQLVLQNGNSPTSTTCFPIVDKPNHEGRRTIVKATDGIHSDAINVIESLQPYHSESDHRLSHLWKLTTFCNIQKHRQIAAFGTNSPWQFRVRAYQGQDTQEHLCWSEQINNCTIMHFPLAAKDYIDFNPDGAALDLQFVENVGGMSLRYQDCVEMYQFVANEVLPRFARFFPCPYPHRLPTHE